MGCFLGCFGASKNHRRQRRREHVQPRGNRISEGSSKNDHLKAEVPMVEEISKVSENQNPDLYEKVEERCNRSPTRKKVTFDSNIKTYEHILPDESVEFPKDKEEIRPEEKPVKSSQIQSPSENSSITSNSSGTFPPKHRYQNCRESDDEEDGIECDESDLDDIDDEDGLFDEDYYSDGGGYYESKLPNQAKEVYAEKIAENGLEMEEIEAEPRGSNASARDRSGYVHPVLNPVENLTQWKAVKSKGRVIPREPQKENLNIISAFSTEPRLDESSPFSFKPKPRDEPKKTKNQEFAVDASLSTWLSSSETTPEKTNSCNSTPINNHDERPIPGALTAEEIKKFSAFSSPRKSPSKSPDETPIIGSVGSCWDHSDKRLNRHSTPFEARLERGLNS
ncbi:PREDICTED: DNA ligase 1-like isoform X2 [Tarenaya hassleriana]|uniref:DNA ligase 1-like isoform X2 n=1 Tax=Tarenaya hassleriana TaxID=28532 RepID=UPI00053C31C5|nr:PREDICTED: DNA ligase 1-like isoform X2 [Tarenaya hassleriana]